MKSRVELEVNELDFVLHVGREGMELGMVTTDRLVGERRHDGSREEYFVARLVPVSFAGAIAESISKDLITRILEEKRFKIRAARPVEEE